MAVEDVDHMFKILIIGDTAVGKTSIISRFTSDKFSSHEPSTIFVAFTVKNIVLGDKKVKLQLWDTAGDERFKNARASYYRGETHGVVIVYDITSRTSFLHLSQWLADIRDRVNPPPKAILILGNKSDLSPKREVPPEEAEAFADQNNACFIETSAMEGTNVEGAFATLTTEILAAMKVAGQTSIRKTKSLRSSNTGKTPGSEDQTTPLMTPTGGPEDLFTACQCCSLS